MGGVDYLEIPPDPHSLTEKTRTEHSDTDHSRFRLTRERTQDESLAPRLSPAGNPRVLHHDGIGHLVVPALLARAKKG
jgi:hypothetical protein